MLRAAVSVMCMGDEDVKRVGPIGWLWYMNIRALSWGSSRPDRQPDSEELPPLG